MVTRGRATKEDKAKENQETERITNEAGNKRNIDGTVKKGKKPKPKENLQRMKELI